VRGGLSIRSEIRGESRARSSALHQAGGGPGGQLAGGHAASPYAGRRTPRVEPQIAVGARRLTPGKRYAARGWKRAAWWVRYAARGWRRAEWWVRYTARGWRRAECWMVTLRRSALAAACVAESTAIRASAQLCAQSDRSNHVASSSPSRQDRSEDRAVRARDQSGSKQRPRGESTAIGREVGRSSVRSRVAVLVRARTARLHSRSLETTIYLWQRWQKFDTAVTCGNWRSLVYARRTASVRAPSAGHE